MRIIFFRLVLECSLFCDWNIWPFSHTYPLPVPPILFPTPSSVTFPTVSPFAHLISLYLLHQGDAPKRYTVPPLSSTLDDAVQKGLTTTAMTVMLCISLRPSYL